jgi:hypothetical protein
MANIVANRLPRFDFKTKAAYGKPFLLETLKKFIEYRHVFNDNLRHSRQLTPGYHRVQPVLIPSEKALTVKKNILPVSPEQRGKQRPPLRDRQLRHGFGAHTERPVKPRNGSGNAPEAEELQERRVFLEVPQAPEQNRPRNASSKGYSCGSGGIQEEDRGRVSELA